MAKAFKLSFDVAYSNGTTAVVATRPATELAYERQFGVSVAAMFRGARDDMTREEALEWFATQIKSEHVSFLAWHSARSGLDFEAWLDTVEEIGWRIAESVDPTLPAPSAGS